jgi:hypothetical protein
MHSRSCGGIYCDGCCPGLENRVCVYCMRGLTPGNHIFHHQTEQRDSISTRYYSGALYYCYYCYYCYCCYYCYYCYCCYYILICICLMLCLIHHDYTAPHIFDRTTFVPLPRLTHGSLYDDNFVCLEPGASAHKSGYFQFSNRADTVCAVKIVAEGSNVYNEITRPPFLSGEGNLSL